MNNLNLDLRYIIKHKNTSFNDLKKSEGAKFISDAHIKLINLNILILNLKLIIKYT